jgi:formate dehydrogenase major subunit
MLLTKKSSGSVSKTNGFVNNVNAVLGTVDRRAFLRRSGMVAGAGAFASQLPFSMVKKAEAVSLADAVAAGGKIEVKRTVCTHCSVGCAIDAVVQNGVWVRLIWARTVPKVRRFVNTATANTDLNTR